jgi:glutamate N-acetyltransferase/amino-acid N-acetyltransferase
VGITTANVVRAPIQRSFASDDNFAEITAKISAQQVLADNLGLALAVCATGLTGKLKAAGNARIILPLVAFIPLCSIDLYCIYRELKAVQLKTINRERGEIIAEGFVRNGKVPSFKVVADTERLLIPARLDESALPLRIRPLSEACPTVESLANALNNDPNTPYILSYLYPNESDNFRKKRVSERLGGFLAKVAKVFNGSDSSRNKKMKGHATLAFAQHATSRDVMQAVLQVAHLRVLPFRKDLTQDEARVWALDESKRKSEQDVDAFISELHQNGWLSGKILLSSAERAPYRVDSGCVGVLGEGEDVLTK